MTARAVASIRTRSRLLVTASFSATLHDPTAKRHMVNKIRARWSGRRSASRPPAKSPQLRQRYRRSPKVALRPLYGRAPGRAGVCGGGFRLAGTRKGTEPAGHASNWA